MTKVVEYWEAVLKCLHIFKAKAHLKEIHAKMLCKHLQRLKQPSEGEDRPESDHGLTPREEYNVHDEKDTETYSQEPYYKKRLIRWKKRLDHFHQNCCIVMKMKKLLTLRRIGLYWKRMAMKAMGAMEEGDAVFGSGAEVNLDSQCRCVGGMTNTELENRNILTEFTLDMIGTSIIRPITITIIHLPKLCKDINLISSTQTLSARKRLPYTPLRRMETVGRHASLGSMLDHRTRIL